MASQIPHLSQSPQDKGWGLAGAGRLVSNAFQKSYSFIANRGRSLLPFFFTQKSQNPSIGLNNGFDDSFLKNRSFQVNESKPSSDLSYATNFGFGKGLWQTNKINDKQSPAVGHDEQQKNDHLLSSNILDTATKANAIFQRKQEEPWWNVTGPSEDFMYVIGGIPGAYRAVDDLYRTVVNQPTPTGNAALGMISSANVLTGYIIGCNGYQENKEASKVKDFWGKIHGKIDMVRGPLTTLSGVIAVPLRALSLAPTTASTQASVQSASTVLGGVSSALGAITSLLVAIPSMVSVAKGAKFSWKLKAVIDDPEIQTKEEKLGAEIQYVMDQVDLTRSNRKEIALRVKKDASIWENGKVKPVDIDPEDEKLLSEHDMDYTDGFAEAISEECDYDDCTVMQVKEHLKNEFIIKKKRKQREFGRKAGADSVKLIDDEVKKPEEEQLLNRLRDLGDITAVEKAEKFVEQIKKNTNFHLFLHAAVVFFYVLGAIASLAGILAGIVGSGGGLGIAIAVLVVVFAIGGLAIDGYGLYQAYKNKDPKIKDKVVLALFGVLMTSTMILGVVFSGGVVPLVATGVVGLLWIGCAGYSYYQWSSKKKKKKLKIDNDTAVENERIRRIREEQLRYRILGEQVKEELA